MNQCSKKHKFKIKQEAHRALTSIWILLELC